MLGGAKYFERVDGIYVTHLVRSKLPPPVNRLLELTPHLFAKTLVIARRGRTPDP